MQSDKNETSALNLPSGYFGMVPGIRVPGFAWRYAATILPVGRWPGNTLAKMLFGYGLLQLLFTLRLIPWYLRQPFNVSFCSFSFGVSALATTGLHLGHEAGSGFYHNLAIPLFIFTNIIIALLLLRTLLLRTDRAMLKKPEERK